jgi:hypothetical protein
VISCLQSVDACVAELFDMFPHTPRMHDFCATVADEDWYEPKDLGIKWTRKQLENSKCFQKFHFRSFLWFTKLKGVNVVYINWYSSRFTKNGIFRRFHFWSKRGLRNRGA